MKALSEAGWKVTLLDATPDPAALKGGWKTKTGRPVEAGFKGFWNQYPNIFALVKELGLKDDQVFTPLTRSGLYTPKGLYTQAPIFSQLPRLPSPFGQALYTAPLFTDLPFSDRLSITGLIIEMTRYNSSPERYVYYDKLTALELFRQCGVSKGLLDGFLTPILLVGLFAPPEQLSAALVMDMLVYYAIAHQADFDVKWARGPINEVLISPLAQSIIKRSEGQAEIKGSSRVKEVKIDDTSSDVEITFNENGTEKTLKADALILAMGSTGLKRLVSSSPTLAEKSYDLRKAAGSLGAIDVMATRIWFDRAVMCEFPSNVFANFPELEGAGGTFFCLDQLHDDPYGPNHQGPKGSVIAADFYNAGNLLSLTDDEIVRRLTEVLLPTAVPGFKEAKVIDSWVQRFPQAVTRFSPGSAEFRPPISLDGISNVLVAGDLVKDLNHGSAGLCQERAYVAGIEAANRLIRKYGGSAEHPILDIEKDEPQFKALKQVAKSADNVISSLGVDKWIF
uniref:Amine oxidase domain-containing protein n=1 Tax=Amorphochlora amoebiformis TaxID=1561963 RepID=A0A7S0DH89_9EUKA